MHSFLPRIGHKGGLFVNAGKKQPFPLWPHSIWISWTVYWVPTLRRNILTKIFSIELTKIPIGYNIMPAWSSIHG